MLGRMASVPSASPPAAPSAQPASAAHVAAIRRGAVVAAAWVLGELLFLLPLVLFAGAVWLLDAAL
jgi:hypothetical protein